jgi:signal transduction histidine kinase
LDNLLGNSLKFPPQGGKVTLDVSLGKNEVQFSVADSGRGIPPEGLSRVFEPYWQVEKTKQGMGLGLFIAKTIVESHGGKSGWKVPRGVSRHFISHYHLSIQLPPDRRFMAYCYLPSPLEPPTATGGPPWADFALSLPR